jgi:exonuclease VII small subunit
MDNALRQATFAALQEEMAIINFANGMYLDRQGHSLAADAEYQWRQERLEQVRKELEDLTSRAASVSQSEQSSREGLNVDTVNRH